MQIMHESKKYNAYLTNYLTTRHLQTLLKQTLREVELFDSVFTEIRVDENLVEYTMNKKVEWTPFRINS